jgi:hypothetical protein
MGLLLIEFSFTVILKTNHFAINHLAKFLY